MAIQDATGRMFKSERFREPRVRSRPSGSARGRRHRRAGERGLQVQRHQQEAKQQWVDAELVNPSKAQFMLSQFIILIWAAERRST